MTSAAQILAAEFEAIKADLTAKYTESGSGATGSWPATLSVEATGTNAKLWGAGYIDGREPGTPPPSEAIAQWIVNKGIAARMENNISLSSLAFLIARKIGREGWKPKGGSLIESVVTPQRMQGIIDKAGDYYLMQFTREITNYLKTAAA